MSPRERVFTALSHREPDIIPWGEHWIDYNVYEDILGRESFVHAKMKETKAWWDGRGEEIVASYKRDTVDLADALGLDIVTVQLLGNDQKPMKQLDEDTYEDGNLYRVSSATHDLMPYRMNPKAYIYPLRWRVWKKGSTRLSVKG